jgi:hypothetical protein
MPTRGALLRRLLGLLVAASLVGACGTPTPTPSPTTAPTSTPGASATAALPTSSSEPPDVYAEIEAQVTELRGLALKRPVEPRIVSPDEIAQILRQSVEEDTPADLLAAYERLYQGLGLMDPDQRLADVYVDLLESQVGGLYVPSDERLYVVSRDGTVDAVERVLFAHEFTHALQDQHFDLEAIQDGLVDQTDRQLARLALVEGDAYVANTRWMLQHLSAAELRELIELSSDPETLAALERIPPIVQSSILFAATQGTQWVLQIQSRGGWEAVDAVWARPPESTEQILHPEKYDANEPPIEVELPDDLARRLGSGWSVLLEDTIGEHQLGIWLSGVDAPSGIAATLPAAAAEAAAGWGGDRIVLLGGPNDTTAIVLVTEWDGTPDAGEFAERATAVLVELGVRGLVAHQPGSTKAVVLIGSDDEIVLSLDRLVGLTGV